MTVSQDSESQQTAQQQQHTKAADVPVPSSPVETKRLVSPQVSSYFIAGGIAGAASRTVVSPLERIKIIQYAPCFFFHSFSKN